MKPTIAIREFDSSTGVITKIHDPIGFGEVLSGGISGIKVFDFVVTGVGSISDFTLTLTDSDGIEVSPPDASVENNLADDGNFGIETAETFQAKTTLSTFFAEIDLPVSVPMRSSYVTNFVYLNLSPGTYEKVGGIIKYKIGFKYDSQESSSSASSASSSSSSSSLGALLYYKYGDYIIIVKPLYFNRIAEECEDKSIVYDNQDTDITVAEYPCDSGIWGIFEGASLIGTHTPGVLGIYTNGWEVTDSL